MSASYTIQTTSGNLVILPEAVDTASASISLVGQNSSGWGYHVNQNMVDLLTHNARKPKPNFPMKGEMWFDRTINQLMVYVGTSVANPTGWIKINSATEAGSNADLLNSQPGSYYLDLTNATGTLPTGRLTGTYSISITGNAATATNASDAVNANFLRRGGDNVPMSFVWSDGGAQPPWVWGGTDGVNMRVFNPSLFHVTSATRLATPRSISVSGNATGSTIFDGTGNVDISITVSTAGKLTTARTISVTGDVVGSTSFDGTANANIAASVPGIGNWRSASINNNTGTLTIEDFGKFYQVNAGGPYSYTLPTPIGHGGKNFLFWNNTSVQMNLITTGGVFFGPYGNGTTSVILPAGASCVTTSDDYNWVVHSVSFRAGNGTGIVQNTIPAGTVMYFSGTTPPPGWLKANGAAISRTAYAELFSVVGTWFSTLYGNSSSTTFNIPDLRGEFLRGWDDGRGIAAAVYFGTSYGDAMRNIVGSFDGNIDDGSGGKTGPFYWDGVSYYGGSNGNAQGPGGGGLIRFDASRVVPTADEFRPRNVPLLACIKY